ncbi:MAG: hypothetical protein ACLQAT_10620 [Candidatus Binataceae bacterium]
MKAKAEKLCQGVRPNGGRCGARRLAGSQFCFFHDPDKASERKAAQRAGGQKKKMAVLPSSAPDAKLETADDAVKLLADTINQVRRGEIDPKIANAVGHLAGLLMRGLKDSETERRLAALESAVRRNFEDDAEADQWSAPSIKQNGND